MAPAKRSFGLFGGGANTGLPSGYLAAEFLESTGTQWLNTQYVPTTYSGVYVDYEYTANTKGGTWVIMSYDNASAAVAPIVQRKGTSASCYWEGKVDPGVYTYATGDRCVSTLNFVDDGQAVIRLPAKSYGYRLEGWNSSMKHRFSYIPTDSLRIWYTKWNNNGISPWKVYVLKISENTDIVREFVPMIDKNGVPCMFDKITKQPFYNNGTGQFIVGMTMKQARKLSRLPKTGGSLTVSLPWEAQLVQHNGDVEAALGTAQGNGWLVGVQYRDAEADSAVYNKYNECTTVAEVAAVNADYKKDLTAEGEWGYPLDKLETEEGVFYAAAALKVFRKTLSALKKGSTTFQSAGLVELEIDLPVLTNSANLAYGCTALKLVSINAPNATNMRSTIHNSYLVTILKGYFPKVATAPSMCQGAWSLSIVEAEFPSLSDASGMFDSCVLNKESELRVLNSLPRYTSGTHRITIGIHVDFQTDDEVLTAIVEAEAKGWTVTVQWNGTPTAQSASTFGLRRQPVYAKMIEHDGKQNLDWGHYVTNAEENGYQEFASVEEAEEYFGIEKETEI